MRRCVQEFVRPKYDAAWKGIQSRQLHRTILCSSSALFGPTPVASAPRNCAQKHQRRGTPCRPNDILCARPLSPTLCSEHDSLFGVPPGSVFNLRSFLPQICAFCAHLFGRSSLGFRDSDFGFAALGGAFPRSTPQKLQALRCSPMSQVLRPRLCG